MIQIFIGNVHDNVVTQIRIFGNANTVENNVSKEPVLDMGTGTVRPGNIVDQGVCT